VEKTITQGVANTKTEYLDGYQYNNGVLQFFPHAEGYVKHTVNPTNNQSEYDYVYNYKDHLGNIRISYTFETATNTLKTLEENNYYPFGLKHQENLQARSIRFVPSSFASNEWIKGVGFLRPTGENLPTILLNQIVPNSGYQYKFQGQERQDELGLAVYDYGARNYDPALGRWMNIDPLAEKFSIMTPYAYVAGNPIMFVDPDGKDITLPKGTSRENTLRVLGSLQKLTNDKLVYSTQKDGSIKGNV
jgi:RHS repeat-associated protein